MPQRTSVIVQKFGGTSVADARRIHLAARRALRAKLSGSQVVLVVSAMGHSTDRLIELAGQVTSRPSKREMDMLLATGEQVSIALMAMAIHEAGHEAISLTGLQVGLRTDNRFMSARIRSIDTARLQAQLDLGKIVIIAGFQGVDPDFNITTLGRGGSDTTAVALAAALQARMCEIYTDVDGVYTANPRLVPRARKLTHIGYDEMLELAAAGAEVMHPRSIELGKKFNVPIHVRGSFDDNEGTMIGPDSPGMEEAAVRAATLKPRVVRVTLAHLPMRPNLTAELFGKLAEQQIVVDDIIQNVVPGESASASSDAGARITVSFTVDESVLGPAQAMAELLAARFAAGAVEVRSDLCKVSVVGVGMRSQAGVAARMFEALAAERVDIQNVCTSEIVISVLLAAADGQRALQAVHAAFALEGPAA